MNLLLNHKGKFVYYLPFYHMVHKKNQLYLLELLILIALHHNSYYNLYDFDRSWLIYNINKQVFYKFQKFENLIYKCDFDYHIPIDELELVD